MLTKCGYCGFYVQQNDEVCFNCGFLEPANRLISNKFNYKRVIEFSIPLFLIIFFAMFFFTSKETRGQSISIFIFFSVLISVVFALFFNELKESNDRRKRTSSENFDYHNSLEFKAAIIQKRIANLKERSNKIDSVSAKINADDGENLQQVRHKLLEARKLVVSQFARYKVQRQKIELVRLQNSVLPYLFSVNSLNESEIEKGLTAIENTKREIYKIHETLPDYTIADFTENAVIEKENFVSQLDETENSCEKLREALLSKQAARALQDIAPIEENLQLPNAEDVVHSADTFNLQTTLTDFSESFEELESEYRRVRAESETNRKLLEN